MAYISTQKPNPGPIPKEEIIYTIAHEIGHLIIGGGHPDVAADAGSAPLVGTQQVERLMYSDIDGKIQAGALNKNLIVKGEWDTAESWLKTFVDDPPQ